MSWQVLQYGLIVSYYGLMIVTLVNKGMSG